MTIRPSLAMLPVFALLISVSLAPRAEALPEAMNVVAKSLAEHYGVPGDSVTALLDKGMSMESVTERSTRRRPTPPPGRPTRPPKKPARR